MSVFTNEEIVTGTVDVNNFPAVQPVSDNGGSLTVDGPLTDAELRATPIDVNATFTPSGTQDVNLVSTIPVPVTDNGGSLTVDGTVAVSGSVAVTGPLTDTQLRATPVPISGTVTANAGTGNFTVTQATGTNLHVSVDNFPVVFTNLATVTPVSVSTTVATLSAANVAKTQVIIFNESGTLFVKLGTGASSSSYTYRLTANTELEITGYYGIITGTKLTGTSTAMVTEVGI